MYLPAKLEEEAPLAGVGVGLEAEGRVVRPHPAKHDAADVDEHEQREHDLWGGTATAAGGRQMGRWGVGVGVGGKWGQPAHERFRVYAEQEVVYHMLGRACT